MSPMRLLFMSRSLPFHHIGGMEAVAWDLARALARRGHEVEILTTRSDALPPQCEREGVRIRSMDVRPGKYSRAYWRETARLFETEYRDKVDLVLGIGAGAYAIAHRRARGDRPPVLMQSHGHAWGELVSKLSVPNPISWAKSPRAVTNLAKDRVLRRFDRIIAANAAIGRLLVTPPTRWLRGDAPVSVIPNGIDEGHFLFSEEARTAVRAELAIDPSAPVAVSASRLHVQKGLIESLNGFAKARLEQPDLVYIVAGSGPAEAQLRRHAGQLGVASAVRFVGAVGRDALPRILSAGDVFVFTSRWREGLALGPLEAAATGMHCVISDHIETPGLETISADPGDAADIARAIGKGLEIARDAQRLSRLPEQYSLDHAVTLYEECFRSEIAGR